MNLPVKVTENRELVNHIILRRLIRIPPQLKKSFPPILSKPNLHWLVFSSDAFFLLVFVDNMDMDRIQGLLAKGFDPFPGLFAPNESVGAAFGVQGSRNLLIMNCAVELSFGFRLGPNSTMIISDYKQSIKTNELGIYSYAIGLAYIISFGNEIVKDNLYDYLDGLVAYSVEKWRVSVGK